MSDDPEVIRQQMDESRTALAEKLEKLEEKVTETVQSATLSVTETVQTATATVAETVDTVKDAVQGTVESVRSSLEGTVETVKGAFDLNAHVDKHPWPMLIGAFAAGYVGGQLLSGSRTRASTAYAARYNSAFRQPVPAGYSRSEIPNGRFAAATPAPAIKGFAANSHANTMDGLNGVKTLLRDTLSPEIDKLKGLAIGAGLSFVRDLIGQAVPPEFRTEVAGVIDGFTEKLGGKPVRSSMVSSNP
jgi:ElaB/YqjD/DUF883 family membrane-anchored ribosome-binding protein